MRTIEQKIEGLVERAFGRAFASTLQPVELARKLAREMDENKSVSVAQVYVPNEYTVYVSPADHDRFASFESSLTTELGDYLAAHAHAEGLSLLGQPRVILQTDEDLRVGEFGIACRMVDPVGPADHAGERPQAPTAAALPSAPPPRYEPLAGVSGTQILSPEEAREAGLVREELTLVIEGERHRITQRATVLGRSRDCDIVLADPNASRRHAEIRHVGVDYLLVDLESTNGVKVNGQAAKRHPLAHGDVVVMGTTEIRVEAGA